MALRIGRDRVEVTLAPALGHLEVSVFLIMRRKNAPAATRRCADRVAHAGEPKAGLVRAWHVIASNQHRGKSMRSGCPLEPFAQRYSAEATASSPSCGRRKTRERVSPRSESS